MLACSLGFASKKSSFGESAGNLKTEIEQVYNFFKVMHNKSPKTAAEKWCKQNKSWKYAEKKLVGVGGYYVETKNKSVSIKRIDIDKDFYKVWTKSVKHEEACQSLRSILGSPHRSGTYNDGGKYCTWEDGNGIKIEVYTDHLGIITYIYFSLL